MEFTYFHNFLVFTLPGLRRRPAADGRRPTAHGRRPTAHGRRPTADGPRPTAHGRRRPLLGATSPLLGVTSPVLGVTSPLLGAENTRAPLENVGKYGRLGGPTPQKSIRFWRSFLKMVRVTLAILKNDPPKTNTFLGVGPPIP